jgi:UDP:flavonoid glycosyltransferase YjiC (YdhE family)
MSKILMVTWDGAGNFPPERALVRGLLARGHSVHVLAHDTQRSQVKDDGAEFEPLHGVFQWNSGDPFPEDLAFALDNVCMAKGFGSELLSAVDRLSPDLLLVDVTLMQALVAARQSGIPVVVLQHSVHSVLTGAFGPIFDSRLKEINDYAAELGAGSFPSSKALIEGSQHVLVFSYRSFDPAETLAPNVVHVGPLRSRSTTTNAWSRRRPSRPLVVASLSTGYQDQAALLQRLCDALGNLEVEAVVTTGRAIASDSLTASDNTAVVSFVAHEAVLSSADLLICHAGHGSAMAGATFGVPMLCFPMGRDQPMVAKRVAQLGIGSVASPEATALEIERAIAKALADTGIKKRARQFADSVATHPGLDHAVALVEQLVNNAT